MSGRTLLVWLVTGVLVSAGACLHAQEKKPKQQGIEKKDDKTQGKQEEEISPEIRNKIKSLAGKLGGQKPEERENAIEGLIKIGEPVRQYLKELLDTGKDYQVQQRAGWILDAVEVPFFREKGIPAEYLNKKARIRGFLTGMPVRGEQKPPSMWVVGLWSTSENKSYYYHLTGKKAEKCYQIHEYNFHKKEDWEQLWIEVIGIYKKTKDRFGNTYDVIEMENIRVLEATKFKKKKIEIIKEFENLTNFQLGPYFFVIGDRADWVKLGISKSAPEEISNINFNKYMIIAIFRGYFDTLHTIETPSVTLEGNNLDGKRIVVRYEFKAGKRKEKSYPYRIILIKKFALPVTFVENGRYATHGKQFHRPKK